MEQIEDTVLAESPEDTTENEATSLMALASDVEKCSLSTTADATVLTVEDHPSETETGSEETENFEIGSEKVVESPNAERASSYFIIEDVYSHKMFANYRLLDSALLRRIKLHECQFPNPSLSCQVNCAMQLYFWKDPEDGVELVKYLFTLTRPLKKHVHVDFVKEVYNTEGLYLRNYKTSAVFTEENFMHECLLFDRQELIPDTRLPAGCCYGNGLIHCFLCGTQNS